MNSFTDKSRAKILTEAQRFKLIDAAVGIVDVTSGPMIFKVCMGIEIIDTCAVATHAIQHISHLNTYISSIDYNIEKFNLYFKHRSEI